MKTGRKRIPTSVLKARGSRHADRPLEPQPEDRAPKCPSHLDTVARVEWKRVCRELRVMGILRAADQSPLAALCQSYSRWVAAEAVIVRDGLIIDTPMGRRANPAVAVARESMDRVCRISAAFGLTPSDRASINAEPVKAKSKTETLDEFISAAPTLKIRKARACR